jgi:hypothetical protein
VAELKESIQEKISRYKTRYYLNLLIRGTIIVLTVLCSVFLFFVFLEYLLHAGKVFRSILFFSYIIIAGVVLYRWLFVHVYHLGFKHSRMSDEAAARDIGAFFPEVRDRLLNLIQLNHSYRHNALAAASIAQRSSQLSNTRFQDAVDFRKNLPYMRTLLLPFVLGALSSIFFPNAITEPSRRIVHFNREYIPQAPFLFVVENNDLLAYKNEDFDLQLELRGDAIPETVYINTADRKIKMRKKDATHFFHTFEKIQHNSELQFEAAGFNSATYEINVVNRPNISNFNIRANYPAYLGRDPENIGNIGNLTVPEGTQLHWMFNTLDTEQFAIYFDDDSTDFPLQSIDDQLFEFKKTVYESTDYTLHLSNRYSENKDLIRYNIAVIPDAYPTINVEQFGDTTMYDFLILGGNISDDYGLTELRVYYRIIKSARDTDDDFSDIAIPIDSRSNSQSFYYPWQLEDLSLDLGDKMEYYLQVRDNDAINGRKATRTGTYIFRVPTRNQLREDIEKSTQETENQIDNSLKEAAELNEKLDELDRKLKGKKELTWQDKKMIDDLLKQKNALDKALEELKERYKADNFKHDKLDKEKSQQIQEKVQQLQQLMEELLDEDTRKLYEELQKLLEEQTDMNKIKDMIDQLNFREDNLEKELERTLELFKRIKFEQMLQQSINQLKELSREQEQLSRENMEKEGESQQMLDDQEELSQAFEELKEEIREMQQMNQELKNPAPMQDISEEQQKVDDEQENAEEMLEKNKMKQAGKAQQNAAEQMKSMAQKMEEMQSAMMSSTMDINLSLMRDLLDNLIKLSFSQEDLMVEFRKVNQSDPQFLSLSKKQLDIKDDAKVIQDSLLSLAKQDFRIQSFVTREVTEMNRYLDASVQSIRERKQGEAVGFQQYAMTSINNLALMLDDVMTQMMNAMSSGGGQPKNQPVPSMSELQKQLSQNISELKKSGQKGRELSEELSRMAAEQERIRKMLEELEEKMDQENGGKSGGSDLGELKQKMEQSEWDLVNKRLTDQLIQRQQEIVTRLLEAEESMRERELDEEREAEQARDFERIIPKAFEEYIKTKEKEIDLLKTVPPRLNPYYKKEVNDYFKRIGSF